MPRGYGRGFGRGRGMAAMGYAPYGYEYYRPGLLDRFRGWLGYGAGYGMGYGRGMGMGRGYGATMGYCPYTGMPRGWRWTQYGQYPVQYPAYGYQYPQYRRDEE